MKMGAGAKSQGPVGSLWSQRGPWDREKRFYPGVGYCRMVLRAYLRFTGLAFVTLENWARKT